MPESGADGLAVQVNQPEACADTSQLLNKLTVDELIF
ncbi:hypothetical protein SDC9_184921 [bioreactor metagenome]|uniref:Uncharacterized protein n=1 Tax=bioreactor metagenome TaxID=1076179 RepID=A0A645HMR6_9ZZZZ